MLRVTIEKHYALAGEYWTNVYFHGGNDFAAAAQFANGVVAAERALYHSGITITKYRIDDNVENTDNFVTVPLNVSGTRAATSDPLPLFATGRVDFAAGTGRPSRKYIRGLLQENDTAAFKLTNSALAELQAYGSAVVAAGDYVDVDGQDISSAAASPDIAMRQLRRGSKKKVTP